MPKMKTHKGIKKRIKITGTGKVMRYRAGRRHLLSAKSAKRKRHMAKAVVQQGAFGKHFLRQVGGG